MLGTQVMQGATVLVNAPYENIVDEFVNLLVSLWDVRSRAFSFLSSFIIFLFSMFHWMWFMTIDDVGLDEEDARPEVNNEFDYFEEENVDDYEYEYIPVAVHDEANNIGDEFRVSVLSVLVQQRQRGRTMTEQAGNNPEGESRVPQLYQWRR